MWIKSTVFDEIYIYNRTGTECWKLFVVRTSVEHDCMCSHSITIKLECSFLANVDIAGLGMIHLK